MKPMLAGKYDAAKVAKKLPLLGQLKYDGIRVFVKGGYAYTRSLKLVRSAEIQSWVRNNSDFLEGLDGEIICGDPRAEGCFQRTSSFVMSYDKTDDFTFYVFDKWDEPDTFEKRFAVVEEICGQFIMTDNPIAEAAETRQLETMEDVNKFHDEMISQGQEGIILRDPHAYYKFGRGSPVKCECIKMKEGGWLDTEALIIGFNEEFENTNEATLDELGHTQRSGHKENLIGKETLGSFNIKGTFPDDELLSKRLRGEKYETRCGSGLDEEFRRNAWMNRPHFMGKIVKFKFFTVGIKDKPRFPIFLGIRDPDDMDPEQLDLFAEPEKDLPLNDYGFYTNSDGEDYYGHFHNPEVSN
tara:strand:+ start:9197 stop:10261 length:1065 start_codon:yes stop_codon:yes gene_type:complete